ncbi:MAG: hypothetical protein H6559_16700 [Lewinellaceae bacterium]|nr:hypothetical protein [Lewinellaceae bacterium]
MKEGKGVIRHFDKSNYHLPFNYIRHIYEDNEGVFWLATKGGGVIRWRLQFSEEGAQSGNAPSAASKSSYKQFTMEDTTDNFTYAVYEDDYSKLWIPSDKGLMQMDKASFRVRTFTTEDYCRTTSLIFRLITRQRTALCILAGCILDHLSSQGVCRQRRQFNPYTFTGYYVLEEGADKMADKTQLLQQGGAITIRPGDKFFELHFTLLDYEDTDKHRYAYQIEGYSDNWNYIDENSIRITNLPYGNYTLRIQGRTAAMAGRSGNYRWRSVSQSLLPAMVVHCCCRPFGGRHPGCRAVADQRAGKWERTPGSGST